MKLATMIYVLLSIMVLTSNQVTAKQLNLDEWTPAEQLQKDNIRVELYNHKKSTIKAFKVMTHVRASMDSILAVMMDSHSCIEWVYGCKGSRLIDRLSFNEQYHYQICDIPFPFKDRDFIFHSIMKQEPQTKAITISITSVPDYCRKNQSEACKKINHSKLVRVKQSIGVYKLEPDEQGTKITWSQHTEPSGSLPSWLVNQFIKDTPYWTMKKLAGKVQEDKYKKAKLVYNSQGVAIAIDNIQKNNNLAVQEFRNFPSF